MPNEIDLRDLFNVILRRWKFIAAMPLLAIIAAGAVTALTKPTYEATATIALAPATVSISLANQLPPYYLMVDSPRHLPTAYTPAYYIAVLQSAEVVSAANVRGSITISNDANDRSLLRLTARGADAKNVADAANQYAQAGIAQIEKLLMPTGDDARAAKNKLDTAQEALDKFLSDHHIGNYDPALPPELPADQRKQLADLNRARDLAEAVYLEFARDYAKSEILAATAYRPTLLSASVPASPIAPQLVQNLLFGGAIGLFIGLLGAFALELVRR
jgi:capsular polysaccharide biosynthesis protein